MDAASELIRSRTNQRYRRFLQLKQKGSADLCLLEGPKLVEEAVLAGVHIVEVAVASHAESTDSVRRHLVTLAERGVPVHRMDASLVASLSEVETSQGLVALARRPAFDEDRLSDGVPLIVVAVGIQDPGNLGGLLRTAEAAGASGAYLTEGTADPFSWKALRGSMGSAFRLPTVRGLAVADVVARLRARGVAIVGTAASGTTAYTEADWRRPAALLLGNEGAGLSHEVLQQADTVVSIPLRGRVESLNVGVAAGLLLFEAARQRGK
jgi:TrmH family RNA methyltransferase